MTAELSGYHTRTPNAAQRRCSNEYVSIGGRGGDVYRQCLCRRRCDGEIPMFGKDCE